MKFRTRSIFCYCVDAYHFIFSVLSKKEKHVYMVSILTLLSIILTRSVCFADIEPVYEDDFTIEPTGWTFEDRTESGGCNWTYENDFGGFRVAAADVDAFEFCKSWLELPLIYTSYQLADDLYVYGNIDKSEGDILEIWQLVNETDWELLWTITDADAQYENAWVVLHDSWPLKLGFYYENTVEDTGYWEIDRIMVEAFIDDDGGDDDDTADDDDNSDDDDDEDGGGGDDDDNGGCCG